MIPELEGEDEFSQPRFQNVAGGRIYIDDNNDRFGLPVRPLKPIEMKPGPGAYFVNGEGGANNMADLTLPIEEGATFGVAERMGGQTA